MKPKILCSAKTYISSAKFFSIFPQEKFKSGRYVSFFPPKILFNEIIVEFIVESFEQILQIGNFICFISGIKSYIIDSWWFPEYDTSDIKFGKRFIMFDLSFS